MPQEECKDAVDALANVEGQANADAGSELQRTNPQTLKVFHLP